MKEHINLNSAFQNDQSMHHLYLETENHFVRLALPLRQEILNSNGLNDLSSSIRSIFGYNLECVLSIDSDGLLKQIFTSTPPLDCQPDSDFEVLLKISFNKSCPFSILVSKTNSLFREPMFQIDYLCLDPKPRTLL